MTRRKVQIYFFFHAMKRTKKTQRPAASNAYRLDRDLMERLALARRDQFARAGLPEPSMKSYIASILELHVANLAQAVSGAS